jgi:hypothetical protein
MEWFGKIGESQNWGRHQRRLESFESGLVVGSPNK